MSQNFLFDRQIQSPKSEQVMGAPGEAEGSRQPWKWFHLSYLETKAYISFPLNVERSEDLDVLRANRTNECFCTRLNLFI